MAHYRCSRPTSTVVSVKDSTSAIATPDSAGSVIPSGFFYGGTPTE
ncbi:MULTISPECIES: hypothetical protein [Enterobacterales]